MTKEKSSPNDLSVIQENTPATLIKEALLKGADLSQVEKLLDIQERWEKNEAKKAYHRAMAEFKANPPKIEKDKKVGYSTAKGRVGYSHASLANVVDKITSELSKYGLSASWRTQQNGQIIVTCRITHAMGHSEETSLHADADQTGSKNSIQAIGSTISYLERYTLLAVLGLATTDMDNDGQTEQEKIDENKLGILKSLITELKVNEPKFLEYMKIDKLEDMLKSDYAKAKMALETKKKAEVKK